jgi:AraC family transcriptional regulator
MYSRSQRLLREAPNASISDIAHMIGFTSASHFSRHFKSLAGETPSSFRQKMLGKG